MKLAVGSPEGDGVAYPQADRRGADSPSLDSRTQDAGIALSQRGRNPEEGCPCPHGSHPRIDPPARLLPYLGASRLIMRSHTF